MPRITEETARFWTTVFGGVTAVGLVVGGLYSLIQYQTGKADTERNLKMQLANAEFEAKKPFYERQLVLCGEASSAAAILATPANHAKKELETARGDFWRLYWGPLGMVESSQVEASMVQYGECLRGSCGMDIRMLSLDLAKSCRAQVSESWDISLPDLPHTKAVDVMGMRITPNERRP